MEQHCCVFPVSHVGFKGEGELIDCWLLWCRQSCPSLSVSQWSCHFQCHSDMEIIKRSQKCFTLLLQHPLWKMFVLLLTHLMWLSACWSSLWGFVTLTLDLFKASSTILKLWHMIKCFSALAKKSICSSHGFWLQYAKVTFKAGKHYATSKIWTDFKTLGILLTL